MDGAVLFSVIATAIELLEQVEPDYRRTVHRNAPARVDFFEATAEGPGEG
jgi:hypothetical protein